MPDLNTNGDVLQTKFIKSVPMLTTFEMPSNGVLKKHRRSQDVGLGGGGGTRPCISDAHV